jgi:hypothetical protein
MRDLESCCQGNRWNHPLANTYVSSNILIFFFIPWSNWTIFVSLDTQTRELQNKPKHPKKGEYKEQNGRAHVQEDKKTT